MLKEETVNTVIEIAWKMYGLPYIWGGDDPIKGFDCSGMILELLKSVGIFQPSEDLTADQLMTFFRFKKLESGFPSRGCLVFWCNSEGKAIHVELCLNSELSIGASGGGSKTITEQDAEKMNAFVKVRPINRPDSRTKRFFFFC